MPSDRAVPHDEALDHSIIAHASTIEKSSPRRTRRIWPNRHEFMDHLSLASGIPHPRGRPCSLAVRRLCCLAPKGGIDAYVSVFALAKLAAYRTSDDRSPTCSKRCPEQFCTVRFHLRFGVAFT
jgi:hypothetical protein